MKIDCSKTLNYAKEYKRMCDFYDNNGMCDACPMDEVNDCHNAEKITQEHIDIVQKWSDEHPQETMAEHFWKMFPNAPKNEGGNYPRCCPLSLGWTEKDCLTMTNCKECWNRPYIEKEIEKV